MRKEDPISANSQVTDNSDPREAKSSATKRIIFCSNNNCFRAFAWFFSLWVNAFHFLMSTTFFPRHKSNGKFVFSTRIFRRDKLDHNERLNIYRVVLSKESLKSQKARFRTISQLGCSTSGLIALRFRAYCHIKITLVYGRYLEMQEYNLQFGNLL
jgi:hypothetical protein